MWRICHALDLSPKELARALDLPYAEVRDLLVGQSSLLVEIDRDEVWWRIYEYISERMSYMMAVRHELDKALQKDRIKRLQRTERFNRYHADQ